jgi:hypothetical protein
MKLLHPKRSMIDMKRRSLEITAPYHNELETAEILRRRGLEVVAGIALPFRPKPTAGFYVVRSLVSPPERTGRRAALYGSGLQGGQVYIAPSNQMDDFVFGLRRDIPDAYRLNPLRGAEGIAIVGREALFGAMISARDPDNHVAGKHFIASSSLTEGDQWPNVVITDLSASGTALAASGYEVVRPAAT